MAATSDRFLRDPSPLRAVVADTRLAPLWLGPRFVLGWLWLEAGRTQLKSTPTLAGPATYALILCSLALMLGILTGPAAFAGGSLSVGFWAGAGAGVAALLFAAVVWLMLAWKTAGWFGFDRWLLPLLGMPWRGGALFAKDADGERRFRPQERRRT